jgi:phosphatidylglycerophosphatase A
MKFAAKTLATFFGLGYFPVAPGTLASLAAVLIYKFLLHALAWPIYAALIAGLFLLAVPAAWSESRALGDPDPGVVVVDEVCGQLAALVLVPATWLLVLVSFGLFRFFDILKPWIIRRAEKLPGGWGIMADDLIAGGFSAVLTHLFILWRGARLT